MSLSNNFWKNYSGTSGQISKNLWKFKEKIMEELPKQFLIEYLADLVKVIPEIYLKNFQINGLKNSQNSQGK